MDKYHLKSWMKPLLFYVGSVRQIIFLFFFFLCHWTHAECISFSADKDNFEHLKSSQWIYCWILPLYLFFILIPSTHNVVKQGAVNGQSSCFVSLSGIRASAEERRCFINLSGICRQFQQQCLQFIHWDSLSESD